MLNRVLHRARQSTTTQPSLGGPHGTPTRPRRDDKEETAHATIARYNERVRPLLEDFERQVQQPTEEGRAAPIGSLVRIDADWPVEEIYNQIADHVQL